MEILYLLFLIFYARLLWSMSRDWVNADNLLSQDTIGRDTAVLVPFRNESEYLPKLLLNLEQNTHFSQEVVLINDHSEDHSKSIVASFIRERQYRHWQLLDNPGVGKKAALTAGVEYVKAEIILTTDADCLIPADWPSKITQPFGREHIQLVAGPVMTLPMSGFFSKFQQVEWASLLLVTNYLFARKTPLMCSGANLAYRKSAFLAVNGYCGNDRCLSGDDEFLLEKIIQSFGNDSVDYLTGRELLVKTHPMTSWRGLLAQRVRWAGKGRFRRSHRHLAAAFATYVIALLQLSTVVLLLNPAGGAVVFIVFWIAKVEIERNTLGKVLMSYHVYPSYLQMGLTTILHPVYVALVGLLSMFGKYTWKGRNDRSLS